MIRHFICILSALTLLTACEKDETPARLSVNDTTVVLPDGARTEASFTVTADEAWTIEVSGSGFTVAPDRGGRGKTVVTIRSEQANAGRNRAALGSLGIALRNGKAATDVAVAQHPAIATRTVLMYLPWSGNLTPYFRQNIDDMEQIVRQRVLEDERLLVFFMEDTATAELLEIRYDNGGSLRLSRKRYDPAPDFTTAEGIASILDDARQAAPADRYAMTIGCHGMAWLPVSTTQATQTAHPLAAEKEYWEYGDRPLTRWFGGTESRHRTDIATLAKGIARAGIKMDCILFDDCYMSSIEVAYALRDVTDYLIGSTSEIMAYGFPYARMGYGLFGKIDYEGICEAFHDFYSTYEDPYGTIGVTDCAELDALADIMRRINARWAFDASKLKELQALDGYNPTRFFDMGDYVRQLCTDPALLSEFEEALARAVPWHRHTPQYYSMASNHVHTIRAFSGITTSDPSVSSMTVNAKQETAWWRATH